MLYQHCVQACSGIIQTCQFPGDARRGKITACSRNFASAISFWTFTTSLLPYNLFLSKVYIIPPFAAKARHQQVSHSKAGRVRGHSHSNPILHKHLQLVTCHRLVAFILLTCPHISRVQTNPTYCDETLPVHPVIDRN